MKKKHKQKIYLIILALSVFVIFKTYVLFTPATTDDEIPDKVWAFAVLLIPGK